MVNDLYLSIVYRPVTGAAPSLLAKALARAPRGRAEDGTADALDACDKLGQTLLASFARYEPERLGIYSTNGRSFSRLLEFLALLINGESQPIPLPRAPLNEVLATTRPFFGAEVIEYVCRPTRARVRCSGSEYLPLRNGRPTGFNPLQLPEGPETVEFQKQWLRCLVRGSVPLTVREESDLDHALHGTLALERELRRLSRLIEFTDATRPEGIHARLARWCESTGGDYAWVFDNPRDSIVARLSGQSTIGFDVTDFLDHDVIRSPVTLYLFHCVRQLLDGRPLVCWADEFSRLLADGTFEQFAKHGLKVWRKLNGVFCAATQSPSDAIQSAISRTIIEQTATKVFFPNPDASAEDYMDGFGLTEREFKLIKEQIEPGSRMFLIKQGHCSVVCELDLKGFDAELAVISGRASEVERLRRIMGKVVPIQRDGCRFFNKGFRSGRSAPLGARTSRCANQPEFGLDAGNQIKVAITMQKWPMHSRRGAGDSRVRCIQCLNVLRREG